MDENHDFKKLIIIAFSALSINACTFAAGSLADQLHYTPPEPADLAANPPTESPESKTEQPKLTMTPTLTPTPITTKR